MSKKILFRTFLFISASFISGSLSSQNLDSLIGIWNDTHRSDSIRVDAYREYVRLGFLYSNPDSAFILAQELHRFAGERNYPYSSLMGYRIEGNASAVRNNYARALDSYRKGLVIAEQIGHNESISVFLNNFGNIYFAQKDYSRALNYFLRTLEMEKRAGDQTNIATTLLNIGAVKNALQDYTGAHEYFEKALSMLEKGGDPYALGMVQFNIGATHRSRGDYLQALKFFDEALATYEKISNMAGMPAVLTNMGTTYSLLNQNLRALDFCHRGLSLAEELGSWGEQRDACKCLYDVYKAIGKGNDALVYLERMNVAEDSLQSEETTRKLEQMEFERVMLQDSIAKAEESRKVAEAHREEVSRKNQTRNILIVSALFLLVVAVALYSRWRYVRNAKRVIEKEKDRSENLLLNILPADVAEELKEKGRSEARNYDDVSILFTDFKGFTEASAKLSAQDLVTEINVCFEAFDNIVAEHGIEKIKTIGDAYMAAGGLPVPTPDSARNTVMAALAMQDFIRRRKAENEALGKPAFEMRVGIHTGPVVAGIVGVKKFQYDIWGDTVNTASRMESSGEPGKVNISSATYELVKDQFTCEYRGEIEVKGKGKMGMYFAGKAIR